jgi:hypothetical protein
MGLFIPANFHKGSTPQLGTAEQVPASTCQSTHMLLTGETYNYDDVAVHREISWALDQSPLPPLHRQVPFSA